VGNIVELRPNGRDDAGRRRGWTLLPLREGERPLLRRLFELYLYDFSELEHADLDEDGWFVPSAHPWLARYWTEPGKHAFLLRVEGRPAGLALVDEASPIAGSEECRFLGAFFVARAYRRRGYGERAAREIFDRFPGHWQVLQIRANTAAQVFWRRVIGDYTGGRFGERWVSEREIVQEFDTADKVRG
jgi:predicted acetyltransferase